MGVSIIEIAMLAGVSKSTVSAVINNHEHVRPETRERVMDAIRKLDYHPNIAARELITASPLNIGILMPTDSNQGVPENSRYFDSIDEGSNLELVSKLIEHVSQTKYGVLVEHTVVSDGEPRLPSFALSRRVSGAFQISPLFSSSYVNKLREYVPNVVEIGILNSLCDSVYTDYTEICSLSVDYLVKAGHKRIAYINCCKESRTSEQRICGYVTGLERNGISFDSNLVRHSPFNGIGGYNAFGELWHSCAAKPTAVICATSTIAGGALRFMIENGISVPDDVSVVCNGDNVVSEFVTPRLTAICRDKTEIAHRAFNMMTERLKDKNLPPRAFKTTNIIIERESVKKLN
ncbi:MAG: LacI family DNA-binding transcriptional regulator [Clostridia bacterium]|nr:LacI family DNA-binding transcriptional regulator [Clostridia bacterium]